MSQPRSMRHRLSNEPWGQMSDAMRNGEALGVHHTEHVGEIALHWVEQGTGPLVVLLHGFPQLWYAWRHQIPSLAAAGFRVVALDLRGYGRSEKPSDIVSYSMDRLIADVAALVRHLGAERAHIVGHDWGGVIAWHLAAATPSLVQTLTVINAPHPVRFARLLRTWDQLRRSWYVLFFQLPWLPERLLRAGDFAPIAGLLRRDPARRGAFDRDDIRAHKDALRAPGALTAALNYYRAALRHPRRMSNRGRIEPPTLLLWGDADRHLSPENTVGLERWVPRLRITRLPGVSHWAMHDAPQIVNAELISFLRSPEAADERG